MGMCLEERHQNSKNSRRAVRSYIAPILFLLIAIEGYATIPFVYIIPSSERNAFLFGYSLQRILTGLGIFLIASIFLTISLFLLKPPKSLAKHLAKTGTFISSSRLIQNYGIVILLVGSIFGLYVLLLYSRSELAYTFQLSFERASSLLIWLILLPIQFTIAFIIRYYESITSLLKDRDKSAGLVFIFIILLFTAFHWGTLTFQAGWLQNVEDWFWPFTPRAWNISHVILASSISLIILSAIVMLRMPRHRVRDILYLSIVVYLIQFAFGFADGLEIASIQKKYLRTQFSDEMLLVCEADFDTLTSVRYYEQIYGDSFWYGTKPPGLFAFYAAYRDILSSLLSYPFNQALVCFERLSYYASFIFPLFSSIVVACIYEIDRKIEDDLSGIGPSLLYMAIPSVLLMLLSPDQFLYPLLFSLSVLAVGNSIKHKTFTSGVIPGSLLFIAPFISFSLLPLIGMVIAWITFDFLLINRVEGLRKYWKMLLGYLFGFVILSVITYLLFEYNPVDRYNAAFEYHREIKNFEFSLSHILRYALLNNLEYAIWIGVPFYILTLLGLFRAIYSCFKGRTTQRDVFILAFGLMFIFLNVVGQTKGEVGRIWMFMLPSIVIVALYFPLKIRGISKVTITLFIFSIMLVTSVISFTYLNWPW